MNSKKNGTDAIIQNGYGGLELAYIGDAVYELLARRHMMSGGARRTARLHREVVSRVCAPAQAEAAKRLLPILTESEKDAFSRGRNAHPHTMPKGATPAEYSMATGLEALFGFLYLSGDEARAAQLFALCMQTAQPG